jgi:hypothetical protein
MHILSENLRSALTVPKVRPLYGSHFSSQTALSYKTSTHLNDKEESN